MNQPRNVVILIFNDVEILYFCDPYEVFGITGRRNNTKPFKVYAVAAATPIMALPKTE